MRECPNVLTVQEDIELFYSLPLAPDIIAAEARVSATYKSLCGDFATPHDRAAYAEALQHRHNVLSRAWPQFRRLWYKREAERDGGESRAALPAPSPRPLPTEAEAWAKYNEIRKQQGDGE